MVDARDGKNSIDVPKVFVDEMRELLADDEESNELFEGQEWSDQRLAKHFVAIVQDWNITTPVLDFTLTPIGLLTDDATVQQIRVWMIEAAVGRTLRFGAVRGARNQMSYQAGSMSFDPNQNWANLMQLGTQMLEEWRERKTSKKIELNLSGAFQVAHSDLLVRLVHEYGGIISVVGGQI